MRKLIAPMIAAGLVLAFSLQPSTSAQSTGIPVAPSGADLEAKAKAFLGAMQAHSAEHVFNQLAPWRQSEAELYRARIVKAVRTGGLKWERLEKPTKRLDPSGKLNLQSLEDYAALSAAQMFGLVFGVYRAAADADAARLMADQWFVVDRMIGLGESGGRGERESPRYVLETGGMVTLESVDGGKLTVFCASDGREWFIVDAVFSGVGKERMAVRQAMAALSGDIARGRAPGTDARAGEGEQVLGSMKNRVKVAYAKTNGIPGALTGATGNGGCGVQASELEARYYKCRDAVYSSGTKYGLVCEPKDESDPWLLFAGDMTNPAVDTITHYDTKAEVDAAADAVKRGELPEYKKKSETTATPK